MPKKGEEEQVSPEEIKKDIHEIVTDAFPQQSIVNIGENRGQLLVRIPQLITKRLNLKKGDQIFFKVYNEKGKTKLEVIAPYHDS